MIWGIVIGVALVLFSICIFAVLRVMQSAKRQVSFELAPLKEQITELDKTIQASLTALEESHPPAERDALIEEQNLLGDEVTALESTLREKTSLLSKLSKDLEEKTHSLENLRSDCAHFAELANAIEERRVKAEQERERLLSELDQSAGQVQKMMEEVALTKEQKEKLSELQSLVQNAQQKLQDATAKNAEAAKQFSELQSQYMSLEKELLRLQEKQDESPEQDLPEQTTA